MSSQLQKLKRETFRALADMETCSLPDEVRFREQSRDNEFAYDVVLVSQVGESRKQIAYCFHDSLINNDTIYIHLGIKGALHSLNQFKEKDQCAASRSTNSRS